MMGYLCATCGGIGGLFKTSHAHSDKDSCIAELKAENAKLRTQVEEHKRGVVDPMLHKANAAAVEAMKERDLLLLQIEEIQKAWTHAVSDGVDITAKSQALLEAAIRGKTGKLVGSSQNDHCTQCCENGGSHAMGCPNGGPYDLPE